MSLRLLLAALCVAGCASAKPRARLHYFDIRGLGQPVRLLLSELEIDFEEVRHTPETWPKAKIEGIESGLLTFGQLPALEYWNANGELTTLVQSVAIMNYLGRVHGLTRATDAELAKIDVIAGGVGDVKKRYGAMAYNKNVLDDPSVLEGYKKDIATWTPFFEKAVKGPFVLGEKFSVADILLFDLLDTCILRPEPSALNKQPKLATLFKAVAMRPGIRKYLTSDRSHKWANGASAFFDTKQYRLGKEEEL
eukprot:gene16356-25072_t